MKFNTLFARCAIASAALLAVAGAQASAITVTSKPTVGIKAVSNFGLPTSNAFQVPVFNVAAGGTDWLAFCIDPVTPMDLEHKSTSYVANTSFSGFDNNTSIQRLYSLYFTNTLSTSTAASFQLALWELYKDNGDLSSGLLEVNTRGINGAATAKAIINESASMLLAAKADTAFTPLYDFTSYTAAGSQTIVSANLISAVPEPSTYAMMGIGLAAMGLFARRRKQA